MPRRKASAATAAHRTVRILSMDGGGIRGIIPALILAEIEGRTGKAVAELFNLLAGTSTGGILACGFCKPSSAGGALSALDLVGLYEKRGREIFSRSFWHGVTSVGGIADEKYAADGLEKALQEVLNDAEIKDARADLLVTAYEIERRDAFFFKSRSARVNAEKNFLMRDAARATSAAPTYFEPARVANRGKTQVFSLVDGGVFANNPSLCAFAEAKVIYPEADDYLVVSIGTGEMARSIPYDAAKNWGLSGWVRPLISVIFDGVADTVHYQLQQLLPDREDGEKRYFRFQTKLDEGNDDMDDASPSNIRALRYTAERIIQQQRDEIDQLCELLTGSKRVDYRMA